MIFAWIFVQIRIGFHWWDDQDLVKTFAVYSTDPLAGSICPSSRTYSQTFSIVLYNIPTQYSRNLTSFTTISICIINRECCFSPNPTPLTEVSSELWKTQCSYPIAVDTTLFTALTVYRLTGSQEFTIRKLSEGMPCEAVQLVPVYDRHTA